MELNSKRIVSVVLICGVVACPTTQATDFTPDDAKSLVSAQTALDKEKHAEAIKLLLPLHSKYPTNGEIPRLLMHAYYGVGQFDKARQSALDAISVGRMTSDVLVRLAQIDQQRDDQLALINIAGLLTIIDAENRNWRIIYGDLLADAGRLEESAVVFRTLSKDRPEAVSLHLRLGSVLSRLENYEAALVSFETAWHLGASNPKVAKTLASLCQEMGRDQQALAWIERAAAFGQGEDESLRLQYAQLCWHAQEHNRATQIAESLAESADTNIKARSHLLLGQIAMQRGQVEEAVKHWRQTVAGGVESSQLLAAIGVDYFNKGDFKRAAVALERAVTGEATIDEKNLRLLVISLVQSGDLTAARDHVRRYLEQFGLSDEAKKLVRLWTESAND